MPTSTELESGTLTTEGVVEGLQMLSAPVGCWTVTVTPADGVSRLPLSSTARLMIVTCPGQAGRPGVAPVGPALGRMPCLPAIDRNLDARDDSAARVGGRAGDRDWSPALQGRTGRRRGDHRGRGGMVSRCSSRHEPGLERGRLDPHVGEQVHRRLLHVDISIVQAVAAVVVRIQAPRPLHRAGAEDQGAAAGSVESQAVGRRFWRDDVTIIDEHLGVLRW